MLLLFHKITLILAIFTNIDVQASFNNRCELKDIIIQKLDQKNLDLRHQENWTGSLVMAKNGPILPKVDLVQFYPHQKLIFFLIQVSCTDSVSDVYLRLQ